MSLLMMIKLKWSHMNEDPGKDPALLGQNVKQDIPYDKAHNLQFGEKDADLDDEEDNAHENKGPSSRINRNHHI